MADQNDTTVRAVRTFADDVRRARGESVPESKPVASTKPLATPSQPDFAQGSFRTLEDGRLDISVGAPDEATIVSEHQLQSWSFTQAAVDSLKEWWKDTVDEIRASGPQKTVAPASSRIDIIRAASSNAILAPQDDRKSLVKRLASASTPVMTPATSEKIAAPTDSSPRWAHAEIEKQLEEIPATDIPVPTPPPPPAPTRIVKAPAEIAPEEFRTTSSAPAAAPREDLQARYANNLYTRPAPQEEVSNRSADFVARATEAARERKQREASADTGSPIIVYFGMFIVAGFIFSLIAALGYVLIEKRAPEAPEQTSTEGKGRSFFVVTDSLPIILTTDRTALLTDLSRRVAETGGIPGSFINYYFVYASDAEDTALPAHAFIDTLRLQAPGTFLRTIKNDMMLGVRVGVPNAPFLVLTVKNYEEAFGGMLTWEKALNTDLAPLFGEDVGALGYAPVYTDEIIAGRDVRVLSNADGGVVTVYGFVDQSTLVITTTIEAFVALAQALE